MELILVTYYYNRIFALCGWAQRDKKFIENILREVLRNDCLEEGDLVCGKQ
jgi:hypothetical protein